MDYNVNFEERFYGNTSLPGFGELNLRCVSSNGSYQIIPELRITTRPVLPIGKIQKTELKLKGR